MFYLNNFKEKQNGQSNQTRGGKLNPVYVGSNGASKSSEGWAVVSVSVKGLEIGKKYMVFEHASGSYGPRKPSGISYDWSYITNDVSIVIGTATATSTTCSSSLYGDASSAMYVIKI